MQQRSKSTTRTSARRAPPQVRRAGAGTPRGRSIPVGLYENRIPVELDAIIEAFTAPQQTETKRASARLEIQVMLLAYRMERDSFSNYKDTKKALRKLRKRIASLIAELEPAGDITIDQDGEMDAVNFQTPSASAAPDTAEVIAMVDYRFGVGTGAALREALSSYVTKLDCVLNGMPQRGKPIDQPRHDLVLDLVGPFIELTGKRPNAKFLTASESTIAGRVNESGQENRFWQFVNAINIAHREAIASYCRREHPDKPANEIEAICSEFDVGDIRPALEWAVKQARRNHWRPRTRDVVS